MSVLDFCSFENYGTKSSWTCSFISSFSFALFPSFVQSSSEVYSISFSLSKYLTKTVQTESQLKNYDINIYSINIILLFVGAFKILGVPNVVMGISPSANVKQRFTWIGERTLYKEHTRRKRFPSMYLPVCVRTREEDYAN